MKKLVAGLFLAFIAVTNMYVVAEIISPELAKTTAERLLSADTEWQSEGEASIRLVEHEGVPAYYIIEYNCGGWVIVSAQSSADPLIAYNHTGCYEAPIPMQKVLDNNARYIVDVARVEGHIRHQGWSHPRQYKPATEVASVPDIAPLITIDLNQSYPFNTECPKIDGQSALVGCVAVGMGQAIMVQRYPEAPTGRYSYSCQDIGVLSIDYDSEEPYDWDAMYASEQTGDYSEIARLLYHCGVSVNMMYGLDGSGTQTDLVAKALPRNFGYDENFVRFVNKPESDEEWLEILLDELILGRVIVYRGQGETSGHCWNLDGWKQATQMVHVNWGWGGYGNNYFKINAMEDKYQGTSFPYLNAAVLGVGTPTTAPYGIKLSTLNFPKGTAAGVALADVIVSCEDAEATLSYEILGPTNVAGKHIASPYSVVDGKLVSNTTVEDSNKFKYMKMTVINVNTGESFTREFSVNITSGVSSVMSDAMRVYPSVVENSLTIEVPMSGGEYAIYSVSGVQVAAGQMAGYTTQLDLSSLVAGTYILRYTHSEGVGVKTFIKK